jgi:hypothetical protein
MNEYFAQIPSYFPNGVDDIFSLLGIYQPYSCIFPNLIAEVYD